MYQTGVGLRMVWFFGIGQFQIPFPGAVALEILVLACDTELQLFGHRAQTFQRINTPRMVFAVTG